MSLVFFSPSHATMLHQNHLIFILFLENPYYFITFHRSPLKYTILDASGIRQCKSN